LLKNEKSNFILKKINFVRSYLFFKKLFDRLNEIYVIKWYIWWEYNYLNLWVFDTIVLWKYWEDLNIYNPFAWKEISIKITKSDKWIDEFIEYYLNLLNWLIISKNDKINYLSNSYYWIKIDITNKLKEKIQNSI